MLREIKNAIASYLPGNYRKTLREREQNASAHSHIFCSKPAVIYLTWGIDRSAIHEAMADRPLTLLYLFAWAFKPEEFPGMAQKVLKMLKRHPKHCVVMLCNESYAVDLFRANGVEAIFCNHNCFVNENVFTIQEVEKKYDAIYNATLAPYKRQELAAKVESLAIITYRYGGTYDSEHEKNVRGALAHATWLVDAREDSQKATAQDVVGYYNQSRVGLCLSRKEGAMFVSLEYLLCGLPVVTTRNVGGRDVFFEPEYVEWVDDDPEAVKLGVANLIARAPSARMIREKTLAKMEEHRQRLRELLKDTVPKLDIPWLPGTHGPLTWRNLSELGKQLREL